MPEGKNGWKQFWLQFFIVVTPSALVVFFADEWFYFFNIYLRFHPEVKEQIIIGVILGIGFSWSLLLFVGFLRKWIPRFKNRN